MINNSVLFYETERGEQPVRTYLDRVGRSGQVRDVAAIQRNLDLLVRFGARLPQLGKSRSLAGTGGLWELKVGPHRIAYGQVDDTFVLLHAWRKQAASARQSDVARAKRNFADWLQRNAAMTGSHLSTSTTDVSATPRILRPERSMSASDPVSRQ